MATAEEGSTSTESENLSRLLAETVLELPQTLTDLDRAARHLPIEEDFHFYNNFNAFREPVKALMQRAANVMSQISCLNMLSGASAMPDDDEDLYEWLVNLQDDLLEHVDTSFDQFKIDRAKKGLPAEDDGFMIQDRKKRRKHGKDVQYESDISKTSITKEKNAIRFHKWELARPQEKFADTVDNSNTPFMHPNNAHPLQVFFYHMVLISIFFCICDLIKHLLRKFNFIALLDLGFPFLEFNEVSFECYKKKIISV